MEHPVSPNAMGYSTTGIIEKVGAGVTNFAPGDNVVVSAPHAEYSLRPVAADDPHPQVHHLHPAISLEEGPFHPLSTSSAGWAQALEITAEDRVAVLGQGLVGNLVMQFAKRYGPAQLIAVDALELRCRLAKEVGAPEVVNASEEDPVAAVKRLTGGEGATIVVDCVGGAAGIKSFEQAQKMVGSRRPHSGQRQVPKRAAAPRRRQLSGQAGDRQLPAEYRPRGDRPDCDGGLGERRGARGAAHHAPIRWPAAEGRL